MRQWRRKSPSIYTLEKKNLFYTNGLVQSYFCGTKC
jgi:hypothetical protein